MFGVAMTIMCMINGKKKTGLGCCKGKKKYSLYEGKILNALCKGKIFGALYKGNNLGSFCKGNTLGDFSERKFLGDLCKGKTLVLSVRENFGTVLFMDNSGCWSWWGS